MGRWLVVVVGWLGGWMGMRRFSIVIVAGLSLFLLLAQSGVARAGRAASVKCAPGPPHVRLADAQAEVYTINGPYGGFCETVLRARASGSKRSYYIGEAHQMCGGGAGAAGCSGISLERLAGPVVAYEEWAGTSSLTRYVIVVRNLRTGRIIHKMPTGKFAKPSPMHVGTGLATALVINDEGSVAWIAENAERSLMSEPEVTYFELHVADGSGSRVLAAGTNIKPLSLALASNGTIFWTQGGQSMSAAL